MMKLCEQCGCFIITKYRKKETNYCNNCIKDNKKLSIYQCMNCNIIFSSKKTLLQHNLLHENKEFICIICEKKFQQKRYLHTHMLIHKTITIQCSICEKKFNNKSNYNRHRLIHNSKLINCTLCDKMFHNKEYLKKHQETCLKNFKLKSTPSNTENL